MAAVAANSYFMADKTISRKHLIIEVAGIKPRGWVSLLSNSIFRESIAHSRQTKLNVRPEIVLQDLDFPTNHYLFEGFSRFGAEMNPAHVRKNQPKRM